MPLLRWNDIAREQMTAGIVRQVIHAERLTVSRLALPKGSVVPLHHHENEQITLLQEGRLRFVFPDREEELAGGEVMQIAPNVPHEVHAIEDSLALDVFVPVREDWIRGEDAYLRGGR